MSFIGVFMRILPFVFMLFCFSSSALAGVFCFSGYKYSDNYSFEFTCKADLYFDLLQLNRKRLYRQ